MHPSDAHPSTGFLFALALISAATLAYEILLMRLLSIVQWHHFAYMIISLALLGYGASGALLTLVRAAVQRRFALAFVLNGLLFAASSIACYLLAQQIGFNPLELVWDPRQWERLGAVYAALLLPFFFSANCVCLALTQFKQRANVIYAADLMGAGLGATGAIALLSFVFPLTALAAISAAALAASGLAARALGLRSHLALAILVAGGFLVRTMEQSKNRIFGLRCEKFHGWNFSKCPQEGFESPEDPITAGDWGGGRSRRARPCRPAHFWYNLQGLPS